MNEEMRKSVLGSFIYDVLKSVAGLLVVFGNNIWAIKKTITITLSGKVMVTVIVIVTIIVVVVGLKISKSNYFK